jgi:hypothetical protein
MSFGPDDAGHWRDKLPYVRHDLALVAEREEILRRFGRFDAGFDFGGPVQKQTRYGAYRADDYVLRNTVEPRFTAVDPSTKYTEEIGFGWLADGEREAVTIPLTPYLEVRAAAKNPQNLPHDLLFRDYIRGRGTQSFGVKAEPGEYKVQLLHPDRTVDDLKLHAENGMITIPFPAGEWSVSGIVVKGSKVEQADSLPSVQRFPRPQMRHDPPSTAQAGQPIPLKLAISGAAHVRTVRLYYRPVNQLEKFKMLEAPPGTGFTIPGSDVSARWELMYYFEVLNDLNGGWFQPDPLRETPYYVIKVVPAS